MLKISELVLLVQRRGLYDQCALKLILSVWVEYFAVSIINRHYATGVNSFLVVFVKLDDFPFTSSELLELDGFKATESVHHTLEASLAYLGLTSKCARYLTVLFQDNL
ncbi:hypothetical protein NPIL_77751 [Nephila pilipes]|uniref:Uncharacterized protein n=1 Tax=Nephila pilipes TaxID=299642 RepID=A0A8X6UG47_NEPPI|nr:hypothetical protein NPIL_77751 [Nephila pilipes]